MKKTITILTVLALFTTQARASQLFLRTANFKSKMILSGNHYHSNNGSFEVSQVRPGSHYLTIASKDKGRHGKNRNHLAFRGRIFIPQQSIVYATVTPRGRLIIDNVQPERGHRRNGKGYGKQHKSNGNKYRKHNQNRDWKNDRSRDRGTDHRNDHYRRDWDSDRNTRNGQGGNGWDNNSNRGNGTGGYRSPSNRGSNAADHGSINILLDQVANATFESDKKIVAKQLIDSRPLYSNEVLLIMNEMTYESSKLEIAKYAYNNTLDKPNYTIVNQGFAYSSSLKKLDRFIRQ